MGDPCRCQGSFPDHQDKPLQSTEEEGGAARATKLLVVDIYVQMQVFPSLDHILLMKPHYVTTTRRLE